MINGRKVTNSTMTAEQRLLEAQLAVQEAEAALMEARAAQTDEDCAQSLQLALAIANSDDIMAMVPHDRTSCSDDDPSNAYPNRSGNYRCARCMLLAVVSASSPEVLPRFKLSMNLTFSAVDFQSKYFPDLV